MDTLADLHLDDLLSYYDHPKWGVGGRSRNMFGFLFFVFYVWAKKAKKENERKKKKFGSKALNSFRFLCVRKEISI